MGEPVFNNREGGWGNRQGPEETFPVQGIKIGDLCDQGFLWPRYSRDGIGSVGGATNILTKDTPGVLDRLIVGAGPALPTTLTVTIVRNNVTRSMIFDVQITGSVEIRCAFDSITATLSAAVVTDTVALQGTW